MFNVVRLVNLNRSEHCVYTGTADENRKALFRNAFGELADAFENKDLLNAFLVNFDNSLVSKIISRRPINICSIDPRKIPNIEPSVYIDDLLLREDKTFLFETIEETELRDGEEIKTKTKTETRLVNRYEKILYMRFCNNANPRKVSRPDLKFNGLDASEAFFMEREGGLITITPLCVYHHERCDQTKKDVVKYKMQRGGSTIQFGVAEFLKNERIVFEISDDVFCVTLFENKTVCYELLQTVKILDLKGKAGIKADVLYSTYCWGGNYLYENSSQVRDFLRRAMYRDFTLQDFCDFPEIIYGSLTGFLKLPIDRIEQIYFLAQKVGNGDFGIFHLHSIFIDVFDDDGVILNSTHFSCFTIEVFIRLIFAMKASGVCLRRLSKVFPITEEEAVEAESEIDQLERFKTTMSVFNRLQTLKCIHQLVEIDREYVFYSQNKTILGAITFDEINLILMLIQDFFRKTNDDILFKVVPTIKAKLAFEGLFKRLKYRNFFKIRFDNKPKESENLQLLNVHLQPKLQL